MEKAIKIEIAKDRDEGGAFVDWLNNHGYDARLGNTTGDYFNGECTISSGDANEKINELWAQYCCS